MNKRFTRCLYLLGIVIFATAVGCEPANEAKVTGRVTIDGEPLTHGTVAFFAASKSAGQAATSAIQSDGTFSVQVGQSGKLITGEYAATVTASTPSIPSPDGGPPTPGDLITPARYAAIATSGLRYNIRAGENVIDIALVSDSPAEVADAPAEGETDDVPAAEAEPEAEAALPSSDEAEKATAE